MKINSIQVGQILYINGTIQTEELIVTKIGNKYATFLDSKHRYLLQYQKVQRWKGKSFEFGGTDYFQTAQDAEDYLTKALK